MDDSGVPAMVNVLAIDRGTLYVGGEFISVGGEDRSGEVIEGIRMLGLDALMLIGGPAAVADSPQLIEVEFARLRAAAAAKLGDGGQADGQIVGFERQSPRRAELG